MLDLSAVETVLVNLFGTITGLTFIISDQNAPRPTGQYGTIKITSIERDGWDSTTFEDQPGPDVDVFENIKGLRSLTVSTNVYREQAMQKVEDLRLLIQSSASQQTMRINGLGLNVVSSIKNMAEILDKQIEPRAQVDIGFYVTNEAQLITRAIASVEITGEYQSGSATVPISVEVP